ncbi:hypothetical protein RSAG8_07345, partial [Rhizoctonia solani AG-8 WAC10335]
MASTWKELNLAPPIPLPNKYEAQKSQDLNIDNLSWGAIKILDLLGALFHNNLHDIPTLMEITVLALYVQAVKEYCKLVIQNPDLLLALEAALTNATLDGQIWDQPEEAQLLDSSGVNQKVQAELHNALQEQVEANTIHQAKLHERQSKQRDKLALVKVIEDATHEQLLSMKVNDLDLQIDKLREEGDKCICAKSMAPTKLAKIKEILAVLEQRRVIGINSKLEEKDTMNGVSVGKDIVPQSNEDDWPEDADMYFKGEVVF